MLDFDDCNDWSRKLTKMLSNHVQESVREKIATSNFELIEDARDYLFSLTERDPIIDSIITWIKSETIIGYHGTRLTEVEVDSIRSNGLFPLRATSRSIRLTRALSSHEKWNEVSGQLDVVIYDHGTKCLAGSRENQVHLTLSRSGLTKGFDHYLKYGAEFDQHVAYALLGDEGVELLGRDGAPVLIKVAIPGEEALKAAHPISSLYDLRSRGDVPNLVKKFLDVWCYKLARPEFQAKLLEVDCGMLFDEVVSAKWIIDLEYLS